LKKWVSELLVVKECVPYMHAASREKCTPTTALFDIDHSVLVRTAHRRQASIVLHGKQLLQQQRTLRQSHRKSRSINRWLGVISLHHSVDVVHHETVASEFRKYTQLIQWTICPVLMSHWDIFRLLRHLSVFHWTRQGWSSCSSTEDEYDVSVNWLVARPQHIAASRRLAQRHRVARQQWVCIISRCLGWHLGESELLVSLAARLSYLHGIRQHTRLPQCLPGESPPHCHQLLHLVTGSRRHHGRYPCHAARCLCRGSYLLCSLLLCCLAMLPSILVCPSLPINRPTYLRIQYSFIEMPLALA